MRGMTAGRASLERSACIHYDLLSYLYLLTCTLYNMRLPSMLVSKWMAKTGAAFRMSHKIDLVADTVHTVPIRCSHTNQDTILVDFVPPS